VEKATLVAAEAGPAGADAAGVLSNASGKSVKREKSFMMLIVVDVGSWLREEIEGAEYKVEQPGVGLYTNGARVTTDAAVDARLEVTSSWSLIL
jgi:hypothetical protein